MVASGQGVADRLGGAVLEHDTAVVAEHGVSDRRLDADARRATGEDEVLDAETLKHVVQLGFEEAAEAALPNHDVLRRGLKPGDDVGVPCVADQDPPRCAVGSLDGLADAEEQVPVAVGRTVGTDVREIGQKAHLGYTTGIPTRRAAWMTLAVGATAAWISEMSSPLRCIIPPTDPKSFCMSTTITAACILSRVIGCGLALSDRNSSEVMIASFLWPPRHGGNQNAIIGRQSSYIPR